MWKDMQVNTECQGSFQDLSYYLLLRELFWITKKIKLQKDYDFGIYLQGELMQGGLAQRFYWHVPTFIDPRWKRKQSRVTWNSFIK